MFAELRQAIPRPSWREHYHQAWISPETWSLIDTRIKACQQRDQLSSQALGHAIKSGLQGDMHRQAAKAESVVGSLLASDLPLIRETWIRMWGWYKDAVDRPPPISRMALATMTAEREEFYRHVPHPGETIHVGDLPFLVGDGIPEDEEISWAICRLHLNHSCLVGNAIGKPASKADF